MRTTLSLELGISLVSIPSRQVQVTNIEVEGLGNQWTDGNGSVRPGGGFVLLMSFEQDACKPSVNLSYS